MINGTMRVHDPKLYSNNFHSLLGRFIGAVGIHSRPNEPPTNCLANCNSVQMAAVLTVIILIAIGIGVGVHFLLQRISIEASHSSPREIFFGNEYEDETSKYTYW